MVMGRRVFTRFGFTRAKKYVKFGTILKGKIIAHLV